MAMKNVTEYISDGYEKLRRMIPCLQGKKKRKKIIIKENNEKNNEFEKGKENTLDGYKKTLKIAWKIFYKGQKRKRK